MKFDRRHISSLYVRSAAKAAIFPSAPPAETPSEPVAAEIVTELSPVASETETQVSEEDEQRKET
jgi:hypothetical protein